MEPTAIKGDTDHRIDLPVRVERDEVLQMFKQERTRAKAESMIDEVLDVALRVAKPKGLYRIACVGEHDKEGVEIDGVRFTSRVLSSNLANITTVIPYITTCGRELEETGITSADFMRHYLLETIKLRLMFHAMQHFMGFLGEKYGLSEFTHLHPGEFADWPIGQQTQLFALFDDPDQAIGVKLTPNLTLDPIKSGTGILFSNGLSFESCQLCLQPHCTGRRKPYSPALFKQFTE
jgi:hypothetical protein